MKLKNKILLCAAALVLFISGFAVADASKSDFSLGKNIEILVNMMRELSFFYVDEVDTDKLLDDAAAGMMSSLDPYTEFMPAEEMENFEIMTTGKYGGIGSLIRKKGDHVYISQPYKDFPADKAGLQAGDKILTINGQDAAGMDVTQVSSLLKGDPGTTLKLGVEKFYTGQTEELTIRRERILIPGVPYYGFLADGIGYIQHVDFTEDCSSEFREAFMELRKNGDLKGLVIDYRNNGGGVMREAVKILSMFVPKGTEVVSMKGKTMDAPVRYLTESEPIDTEVPVAVLIGGNSASAAEIVAGAFQDLDRGVVIGQRSYGKGLVQATRPLGYNSYLKVTTAKYYIPSGRCIQAIDYAVRDDEGSVAYIPDSLITEFHTRSGRKVYDGGGVMPDIRIDPEYISRFTLVTYGLGYLDDYVDTYMKRNPMPENVSRFVFTDADYADFVGFMEDKDIEFQSETKRALASLRVQAGRELYLDGIQGEIDEIERKLQDDKRSNLELYREQLQDLIEGEIIIRQFYADGLTSYRLPRDKEVQRAAGLLRNADEYSEILTSKDTDKK